MIQLYVLPVSPWSERAAWSLDHHRIAYRKIVHVPLLGERRLRRLVGDGRARVTVPVLVDGEVKLTDSWDIARYADARGSASALIPDRREGEVREWVEVADRAMNGLRALVAAATLGNPRALDASFPRAVPTWVRPLLRPSARLVLRWFARKYELSLDDLEPAWTEVRRGLDALRRGLARRPAQGVTYLLDRFTYADVAMATLVQGVVPVADCYVPLAPATREVWTQSALADEYADLVAWRDTIYEAHRGRASRTSGA